MPSWGFDGVPTLRPCDALGGTKPYRLHGGVDTSRACHPPAHRRPLAGGRMGVLIAAAIVVIPVVVVMVVSTDGDEQACAQAGDQRQRDQQSQQHSVFHLCSFRARTAQVMISARKARSRARCSRRSGAGQPQVGLDQGGISPGRRCRRPRRSRDASSAKIELGHIIVRRRRPHEKHTHAGFEYVMRGQALIDRFDELPGRDDGHERGHGISPPRAG